MQPFELFTFPVVQRRLGDALFDGATEDAGVEHAHLLSLQLMFLDNATQPRNLALINLQVGR